MPSRHCVAPFPTAAAMLADLEDYAAAARMVASPIRMSETPVTYRHAPPAKGSVEIDSL